jgi:hypothetical protein
MLETQRKLHEAMSGFIEHEALMLLGAVQDDLGPDARRIRLRWGDRELEGRFAQSDAQQRVVSGPVTSSRSGLARGLDRYEQGTDRLRSSALPGLEIGLSEPFG